MSAEWSPLEEVAEVVDSLHKTPSYFDAGFPMVRVTDVKYGTLNLSNSFLVDEATYGEFSRRYKPAVDDIVITRVGTYGVTSRVIETTFCLGQNTAAIIPKSINSRYLYAALNSEFVRAQIEAGVVGSTQKTLSLKHIKALLIPRLGCIEEAEIAATVGFLDDRITLLRETNTTLEAIAHALFKSWFVDFDPVHAKMQGRVPEGMDEATAALFPDGFEESELGLVPRGWRVSSCQDLFDVRDGTHESPKPSLEGYPLVTSKHITSGRVNLQDTYLISEADYVTISKRSKVNRLDVLITMIGTVGLSTILLDEHNDFAIKNIGLFKTSSAPNFAYFLILLLKSSKMQEYLAARLAGTTQKYLSLTALREMRMLVPAEPILAEFSKIAATHFDGICRNHEQAQTLATLRDTLLPRLISGQLRVCEMHNDNMFNLES